MEIREGLALTPSRVVVACEENHNSGTILLAPIVLFGTREFPSNQIVEDYLYRIARLNSAAIVWLFANNHTGLLRVLLYTFVELQDRGKAFMLRWIAPVEIYTDAVQLAFHCNHLMAQNAALRLIVDALMTLYAQYKSGVASTTQCYLENGTVDAILASADQNAKVSRLSLTSQLGQLLTHYTQIGIKTAVCLINTRIRLYTLDDRFKHLNDDTPRFAEPSTTITLLRIYYRLQYINSLSFFDSDPFANTTLPVLAFRDQKSYIDILQLNDI